VVDNHEPDVEDWRGVCETKKLRQQKEWMESKTKRTTRRTACEASMSQSGQLTPAYQDVKDVACGEDDAEADAGVAGGRQHHEEYCPVYAPALGSVC